MITSPIRKIEPATTIRGVSATAGGGATLNGQPIAASRAETVEESLVAVSFPPRLDDESLRRTLETGRTWFWSRSRQEYWCKGETSGDRQFVREAYYDCDGDTLLFVVEQEGRGACHTGERSCFYRAFGASA